MRRGRKPLPVSLQEQQFQEAFDRWERSNYTSKSDWDIMWFRVRECCQSIAKSICRGINNPDLEYRADEAVIYYMNRIQRDHIRPRKLSSWCYLGTKGYLIRPKYQREDAELSFENYEGFEEIKMPETIRGIYRPELNGGKELD